MNTNFSSSGFDSNSNFYNSDWSDHPDFSWQAQAMKNCAPHFQELYYPDYSQFDNQSSHPSSYVYPASSSQSTLEDTLKVFMELTGQAISDVKNATMENTQAIARIEGQLKYLVAEVTRIEEEELQSQLMAAGDYMIDKMMLVILVMSMSLPSPCLRMRKLWIAMRKKRKSTLGT
jgi:hypothetical protein